MSMFSRDQRVLARKQETLLVRIIIDGAHMHEESYVDISGPAPKFVTDEIARVIDAWKEASEAVSGKFMLH